MRQNQGEGGTGRVGGPKKGGGARWSCAGLDAACVWIRIEPIATSQ
jgi:hypothetical protein